tara:strand:+ start:8494 stop:8739 length:246 start_codon:yes stop_codon:yes gene_type:complete
MIVKMYFIQDIPFTFDELPEGSIYDKELIEIANKYYHYEPEDLYKNSFYLIDEEAHPCLFDLDLENPEDMPPDIEYEYKRE